MRLEGTMLPGRGCRLNRPPAAAAIVAGQQAKTLKDGLRIARQSLDTGSAAEKLDRLVAWTNKVS